MSGEAAASKLPTTLTDDLDGPQAVDNLTRLLAHLEDGECLAPCQVEALLARCHPSSPTSDEALKLIFRLFAKQFSLDSGRPHRPLAQPDALKRIFRSTLAVARRSLVFTQSLVSPDDIFIQATVLSAVLRALHAVILVKDSERKSCLSLDQSDLSNVVDVLLSCAHFLPRLPAAQRVLPGPGGPSSLTRRGSAYSLHSESTFSTDDGTDYASEVSTARLSETSATMRKKVSSASRTVRQNALSCLGGLNETLPAQLFTHWPRILSRGSVTFAGLTTSVDAIPNVTSVLPMIRTDPVLSVRLAVCHLAESMFNQAKAKGFLARGVVEQQYGGIGSRFISLSARLGSLVADLRSDLVEILEAASRPEPAAARPTHRENSFIPPAALTLAILRLTGTLVTVTQSAKLKKTHTEVLKDPILRLCSHSDPGIAIAAYNVLSKLTTIATATTLRTSLIHPSVAEVPTQGHSKSTFPSQESSAEAVSSLIQRLSDDNLDQTAHSEAWLTLTTFAAKDPSLVSQHISWLSRQIPIHLATGEGSLRHACINFLVQVSRDCPTEACLPPLLALAAKDISPLIRTDVLQAIPPLLVQQPSNHILRGILDDLVGDGEGTVRAAAIRVVGLLLHSTDRRSPNESPRSFPQDIAIPYTASVLGLQSEDLNKETPFHIAMDALSLDPRRSSPLTDPSLLVRLRASWTLGNLCQSLKDASFSSSPLGRSSQNHLLLPLLTASTKLVCDDERIAINALRSVGLLLSLVTSPWLQTVEHSNQTHRSIILVLETVRRGKNPKTKWNGLNALEGVLANEDLRRWILLPSQPLPSPPPPPPRHASTSRLSTPSTPQPHPPPPSILPTPSSSSSSTNQTQTLPHLLNQLFLAQLQHRSYKVRVAATHCLLRLYKQKAIKEEEEEEEIVVDFPDFEREIQLVRSRVEESIRQVAKEEEEEGEDTEGTGLTPAPTTAPAPALRIDDDDDGDDGNGNGNVNERMERGKIRRSTSLPDLQQTHRKALMNALLRLKDLLDSHVDQRRR